MIFCVEDDSNIRELVVYTLETTGFRARGFEDGKEFWETLALETGTVKPRLNRARKKLCQGLARDGTFSAPRRQTGERGSEA